ncbi:MAG: hypothetical protein ACPGXL_01675 [Chitinophagales bacterium]
MKSVSAIIWGCCLLIPTTNTFAWTSNYIPTNTQHLLASPSGKIMLFALLLVVLINVLFLTSKAKIKEFKTRNDLRHLSYLNPAFDWWKFSKHIDTVYKRVTGLKGNEAKTDLQKWMTRGYWYQQYAKSSGRWKINGWINHCNVEEIKQIKPLYIFYNKNGNGGNGSRVVVSITACKENYRFQQSTGRIMDGHKGFQDEESVWTFELDHGTWKVRSIDGRQRSEEYISLENHMPNGRFASSMR